MRCHVLTGVVCLALGVGAGLGIPRLRPGESRAPAPVVVAIVAETPALRTELAKDPDVVRVVDARLFREAQEARQDEPAMSRLRNACGEFGAGFLVEREHATSKDAAVTVEIVRILDVESGALLWSKSHSSSEGPAPTPLAVEVAAEVAKLAAKTDRRSR